MSGSLSGSSTEPPAEGLLSKFVNTLGSIIASSNISGVSWMGLGTGVEGIKRRPAYRRARVEVRSDEDTGEAEQGCCSGRLIGVKGC